MFKKKICKNCRRKISNEYDFCPYCGNYNLENKKWGMLGKGDSIDFDRDINLVDEIKLPKGMGFLFNSLMKTLDKQFKQFGDFPENIKKVPQHMQKNGISISISTMNGAPPQIKIRELDGKRIKKIEKNEENHSFSSKKFSGEIEKKFLKLPKEEPRTEIKRLSNKIIYEIEMPGVKSLNDVSIIKLEKSIEIKAIAKDKVYSKIIPINLPIMKYHLSKEKLSLELGVKD